MKYFDDEKQDNFKADFGFISPHKTKAKCKNPVFANHNLHRIAIMKDYHIGSKGDIEENGFPGWISKFICTGCGKRYTVNKLKGYFHPDKQLNRTIKMKYTFGMKFFLGHAVFWIIFIFTALFNEANDVYIILGECLSYFCYAIFEILKALNKREE